jgi:integrase
MFMKKCYRMFLRGKTYYCQHNTTGKQESLGTKDKDQARTLLHAKNQAAEQPMLNLHLARVYASASDPRAANRTWQDVMDEAGKTKIGGTAERWVSAMKDKTFDHLRTIRLLETRPDDFLNVLHTGTVSTNVFLRRLHNFALDMDWLLKPVLPKRQWPTVKHKDKRAITFDEYQKIIAREHNPEWNAFYELLWHLGGSQTDVATLQAEDIDWTDCTIAFSRRKSRTPVLLHFGNEAAQLLHTLPQQGCLFPRISQLHEKHRAKQFAKRLATLEMSGISLHSFRYSWAERAKCAGYPERFAQQALGHASKAVSRAYAKKAQIKLPSLEEFERKIIKLTENTKKAVV